MTGSAASIADNQELSSGIRYLQGMVIPPSFSAGRYSVRFAQNISEIHQAQALRYKVFYCEKHGNPSESMVEAKRDMDQWDDGGFHIIVLEKDNVNDDKVVGTVRFFYNQCLQPEQHFYTEETFCLTKLHNHYDKSLELSRACIDPQGRGGSILLLMWKYAMSFIKSNNIPVMFGCASFPEMNLELHKPILNYLYEHHLSPEELRPEPKVEGFVDLHELYEPDNASWEDGQKSIPTLLRGYLKLGAKISDAAILDPAFNTVYVSIYVETKHMLQENPNLVSQV